MLVECVAVQRARGEVCVQLKGWLYREQVDSKVYPSKYPPASKGVCLCAKCEARHVVQGWESLCDCVQSVTPCTERPPKIED